MNCPYCRNPKTKVLETRTIEDGTVLKRKRECLKCKKRFTTNERVQLDPLTVIKKDGTRRPFDQDKLIESMKKACSKRRISESTLKEIAVDIQMKLRETDTDEINSTQIGEEVMNHLKALDQVAYVRFAAVYREFRDLESLMGEIKTLLADKEND